MPINVWVICRNCQYTCDFIEYGPHFRYLIFNRSVTEYFCDHFDHRPILQFLNQLYIDPTLRYSCPPEGQNFIVIFYGRSRN